MKHENFSHLTSVTVNHTERAKGGRIIGLFAHRLLKFFPRAGKSSVSCRVIAAEPGGETLAPTIWKRNVFIVAPVRWHGGHRALGRSGVALA